MVSSSACPPSTIFRPVLPLAGCRGLHACRNPEGTSPGGHITGDHAARADQRIITDGNAWQDDRSRSNPDVAADADWAAKLQARGSPRRVARMIGRQDLHSRPDLRAVSDGDLHDIENHTVEVQKYAGAEANIEAVVAMEWRPDHGAVSDSGEAFHQQLAPLG